MNSATDPAIHATLTELGLAEKEITLYLALLKTGTAPGSTLSRRTGILRSTTQYVCQQLVKKGMASMTRKDNVYLFTPEPPARLLTLLEKQHGVLREREKRVQRIMGPLQGMMAANASMPKVQFYEGTAAILQAMLAMIRGVPEGGELLQFVRPMTEDDTHHLPPGIAPEELERCFEEQFRERINRKVCKRMIASRSPLAESWRETAHAEMRETRIMDGIPLPDAPSEILLGTDVMLGVSADRHSMFAFRLENPAIVGMYRAMFELAWKATEER